MPAPADVETGPGGAPSVAEPASADGEPDRKSPPKSNRANRVTSQRAKQYSQREEGHEAVSVCASPPKSNEISRMMVMTAVRTLNEFERDVDTVEEVCNRVLKAGSGSAESRQEATESGAIQSIIHAMNIHPDQAVVHSKGTMVIHLLCRGTEDGALALKQDATFERGAIYTIVAGMKAHEDVAAIQERGAATIGNLVTSTDDNAVARKHLAAKAGAFDAIAKGMAAHAEAGAVAAAGCFAIGNLCRASDERPKDPKVFESKELALEQGAVDAVIAAIRQHPDNELVLKQGARAVANVAYKNAVFKEKVLQKGALAEWLDEVSSPLEELLIEP